MREFLILVVHLLVTFAKLLRPGGARAVLAESLLLKHQLLISNRSRQRAPNLTSMDRFVLGLTTLFVSPRRIPKLGARALIKPATLLKFHKALVDRKYRLLFSRNVRKLDRLLRGSSFIVIQQSTKPKTTHQRSVSMRRRGARHDQHIADALVVALVMKMGAVFSQHAPQHPLPDRDQPR